MIVIRSLINIVKNGWSVLSDLKIDGVSWTTIVIGFIIVFFVVGSFLHARR